MNLRDAVSALSTLGFVVETAGDRYTVASGGDVLFRQGTRAEFTIFASGIAVGFTAAENMWSARRSLEQKLALSPAHQEGLQGK